MKLLIKELLTHVVHRQKEGRSMNIEDKNRIIEGMKATLRSQSEELRNLKVELIEAYEKRGDYYMAGEKEAIEKRIEELKS